MAVKDCTADCSFVFAISMAVILWFLQGIPVRASVVFPSEVRLGQDVLTLRGHGLVREFYVIKLVDVALYVQDGIAAEDALADVGKRIEMHAFRDIPADDFVREAEIALADNVPAPIVERLRRQLDLLHHAYEDLRPGDRYAITYLPKTGTVLELNGSPRITVDGADFAAAYFRIWLGDHPIHEQLKMLLLERR
jgi:Chalcone isomerase-like